MTSAALLSLLQRKKTTHHLDGAMCSESDFLSFDALRQASQVLPQNLKTPPKPPKTQINMPAWVVLH